MKHGAWRMELEAFRILKEVVFAMSEMRCGDYNHAHEEGTPMTNDD